MHSSGRRRTGTASTRQASLSLSHSARWPAAREREGKSPEAIADRVEAIGREGVGMCARLAYSRLSAGTLFPRAICSRGTSTPRLARMRATYYRPGILSRRREREIEVERKRKR